MISNQELEKYPNYLLSTYQLEIYRQLREYMDAQGLSQTDVAKKLNVSNPYVSQILNGNFNFTLKKLIELGLMIGKIPAIDFISFDEYWLRESVGHSFANITVNVFSDNLLQWPSNKHDDIYGNISNEATTSTVTATVSLGTKFCAEKLN
jgi:predicted transcriptional regulator